MMFENTVQQKFWITYFVIYLTCDTPLRCRGNGILGPQPESATFKSSVQSIFGYQSENKNQSNLNESESRKSQVRQMLEHVRKQ